MPVVVIDTIKPKNNLTFPIVEDVDVLIKASSKRLSEVVATMATQDQITALQTAINGKASQSDLTALSETVSGKASQADLTALSNTVDGKQNALSSAQLAACNSGITTELVAQIGTNTTAIAGKASQSDLDTLSTAVSGKANASDVATEDANLQAQIDNIVGGSTADSEVINARVGADGTSYSTLKQRIDTENSELATTANNLIGLTDNVAYYPHYTQGGYYDGGGVYHADASWGYTPLFKVEPETTYYLNVSTSQYITLYDSSRQLDTVISGGTQFTTTANTAYARISVYETRQSTCVVTKNSTYVSKLADIDKLSDDLKEYKDCINSDPTRLKGIIGDFDFNYATPDMLSLGYWEIVNGVPTINSTSGYWCLCVKNIPAGSYSAQTYAEYQSYIKNLRTGAITSFHDLGFTPSNTFATVSIPYEHDLYLTVRSQSNVFWYNGSDISLGAAPKFGAYNTNFSKIFKVGVNEKYKTLKSGIEAAERYMDSVLYVESGTYDLLTEFGSEYFENFTGEGNYEDGAWGLVLKNRIHIIFAENAKVVCNYTGDNSKVRQYFSAFNAGLYGFTLENANIDTKNIRYCVHDDRGNATESGYINKYIRCRMKHDSSEAEGWGAAQCIGGGFGNNGDILIEDSYFNSIGYNYPVTYHNSADGGNNYRAHCVIKNNYFEGGIKISDTGACELVSDVYISGNSINGYGIYHAKTTQDAADNIMIRSWNNIQRT
jgi:hypothetical protein